ncbi:hypothetical protein SEA_LAILA_13 [Arthrobacter phage Laila]|nr:hypothetical protein SEA_ELKHORN_12 [Arthrobacter phage Elkhorn]ASR83546.1 hypothetical protein SEA_KYLIEMAC_13 [Arthrobacter phage KylieMac]ASR83694.1 hypothetical protein SEA_LORE_12 [Arthrobacter phage Lore]QBP30098.1 hypothetical protein SEA_BLAIR_12 [Arthrobacter phage Blair]QBP30784.1 hypothetical protein SEA_STEWIEGRIFF_12 [Arthrobacter phage StewieGriff]QDB74337.1 hypothetical protein SEA_LAILA_13 [Arthrobacter phage Laila]
MAQLSAPKVIVMLEASGTDELTEYTVQTDNRDAIQWDVTRPRRSWPAFNEAPMLYMTFLAWHAMHRTGATKLSLDEFMKDAVEVKVLSAAGKAIDPTEAVAEDVLVDPTQPAAATA